MTSNPQVIKIIIIGESGVGKTAILRRLLDNSFSEEAQSTIGVEFESRSMNIDGKSVKLQIWDTAGQERFRSIAKAYFRNAHGALLVFDITERRTFDALTTWITDVHTLCDDNVVLQLIGNKSDMQDKRGVTLAEAENFAERHKMKYLETTAKAGDNINEAFIKIASEILKKEQYNTQKVSPPTQFNNEGNRRDGCNC